MITVHDGPWPVILVTMECGETPTEYGATQKARKSDGDLATVGDHDLLRSKRSHVSNCFQAMSTTRFFSDA